MLSIEVHKLSTKPFIITTWNRPPNSSVDLFSHLDILLRKLDTENIEHYLMGDINCNLLSENNANVNALLNISDVYGLKQLITEPTRITPSSSSLIDLIFTNQPDLISFSGVSHVGISDHSLIYAFRKVSIPPASKGIKLVNYGIHSLNTLRTRVNFRAVILVYLKDSNAASHFGNSLILFALSRTA